MSTFAQFYFLRAAASLRPRPSSLSPPTATSSPGSSLPRSHGQSDQLALARAQLPINMHTLSNYLYVEKNSTSIHQLEMRRELRAASTSSIHSFSDSTLPDLHTSFDAHFGLSWEQGSAPQDLDSQSIESEDEHEEQEERQTEEQGAVRHEERQEVRAFKQQDDQKNLLTTRRYVLRANPPVILFCASIFKKNIISANLNLQESNLVCPQFVCEQCQMVLSTWPLMVCCIARSD